MKVKFVELSMSGVYHAQVNSGIVRIFQKMFPGDELLFLAERSHINSIREILDSVGDGDVKYSSLLYFPKATLGTILLRDFLGVIYALWVFVTSSSNTKLFFTNILPVTHWVIYLLSFLCQRSIYISIHGQAEAYVKDSPLKGTKWYFLLEKFIYKNDKKTHYVVFGEPIMKHIKYIFGIYTKVIIIDHPYNYNNTSVTFPSQFSPLRLGQIGVGNIGKGTQLLFDLAKLLQKEIEQGEIVLELIGKLDESLHAKDNGLVSWSKVPLTQYEFESKVSSLHYTLFLRDAQCGRAVASGSFFDTVKYLKPYIALPSDFIVYYTSLFPECGHIYDSMENMAKCIKKIVKCKDIEAVYNDQKKSLIRLQDYLNISNISLSFKSQIEK